MLCVAASHRGVAISWLLVGCSNLKQILAAGFPALAIPPSPALSGHIAHPPSKRSGDFLNILIITQQDMVLSDEPGYYKWFRDWDWDFVPDKDKLLREKSDTTSPPSLLWLLFLSRQSPCPMSIQTRYHLCVTKLIPSYKTFQGAGYMPQNKKWILSSLL